ncbi:TRAP transporter substrate-binding protein [Tropicimonas sp. IMCC34011]|uniref:TRAP transporter substrate-binding protein n=1 Tax=Tropicimonas sp. IMCC34011 TaxID=2248759 RepID=UPI000E26B17B|nr:TRAP transporter substrate-binding protein [Tropicimonas sp. IMCC34011]
MKHSLIAIAGICAAIAGPAQADTTLRFSNWLPPTHYVTTEILEPWAASVAEATEGRVTIEFLAALDAPGGHFDLVDSGIADVAFAVHSYTPQRFVLTEIAELPFMANDATNNSIAYWETYQEYFADADEHAGVKLLGLWTSGPSQFFADETFLDSPTAAKGLKIRTPGKVVQEIAQALGMVPVSASVSESYEMLSRGVIDGLFQQKESVVAFNMDKYLNAETVVPGGFAHSSQFMIMNQDAFDDLSEEDQQAIESVSGEALVRLAAGVWDKYDDEASDSLSAAGVEQLTLSGAALDEIRQTLAFVEQDWLDRATERGVDAQAALEAMRTRIAELEGN